MNARILPRETLACSLCSASLSGGRDTFGDHDWPLCESCRWWEFDVRQAYKNDIDGLSCTEAGKAWRLSQLGFRLDYPKEFAMPDAPTSLCCPECASPLYVEIHEWDTETGFPTSAGVLVGCLSEHSMTPEERESDRRLWGIGHRHLQSDWDVVTANATNYVMRECYRRLVAMAEGVTA